MNINTKTNMRQDIRSDIDKAMQVAAVNTILILAHLDFLAFSERHRKLKKKKKIDSSLELEFCQT